MKFSGFIVAQAVAKQFEGLKGDGIEGHNFVIVYVHKEAAYKSLGIILENIKRGMKYGLRQKDNLDPNVSLDFCITECTIDIPEDKMLKRGWGFANIPK